MLGGDVMSVGAFHRMQSSHNLWRLILRGKLSASKDQLQICLGTLKKTDVK